VKAFNISRITTNFGIFRISGLWDTQCCENMVIESIEQMGTNGWVFLNQANGKMVQYVLRLIIHSAH